MFDKPAMFSQGTTSWPPFLNCTPALKQYARILELVYIKELSILTNLFDSWGIQHQQCCNAAMLQTRMRDQILALLGAIVLRKFLCFSVSSMTGSTP